MEKELAKIKEDFKKEYNNYINRLLEVATSIRVFSFVQDCRLDIVITQIGDEFILQQLNPRFGFPQVPILYYAKALSYFYDDVLKDVEPTNVNIIHHFDGYVEINSNDNIIYKYNSKECNNKKIFKFNKCEVKGLIKYIKENKWLDSDLNLLQIAELDIRTIL